MTMHVPFIDLKRTVSQIKAPVLEYWENCLDNCQFIGGPAVKEFEQRMAEKLQTHSFISCANGTDALMIAMRGLSVGSGMRVAIPNLTFWAPFEAIVLAGAEPVLVDIDPDDLQMDYEGFVEAHQRFHFDAAILPHLYGWCSKNLGKFREYCRENSVVLIEDGAQCFGASFQGKPVLSGAQVGTMSFYPAKVLGASGDAGGICTDDIKLAERLAALCNHGRAGHYTYDYVGMNSRLAALHAGFLLKVLDLSDELLASRQRAESHYQEVLSARSDLCKVYSAPKGVVSNGYLNTMTTLHGDGDAVVGQLAYRGIGAARTYPAPLSSQPPAKRALRAGDLSRSESFCRHVVNLPLFAGITSQEVETSLEAATEILEGLAKS